MDFGGILNKLDNEKLAILLGFVIDKQTMGAARGGNAFTEIQMDLESLVSSPHFPDLTHVWEALTTGTESTVFMPALIGGIVGAILRELNIFPNLDRIGKVLQTLGFGAALGIGAGTLLSFSGSFHSPASPSAQRTMGSLGGQAPSYGY